MSQTVHAYRNIVNGKIGEMTEDQAAIWPDLLVRVDTEPEPEPHDEVPSFDDLIAGATVETKPSTSPRKQRNNP